jgi:uncharacterized protein (DUF697 family)
MGVGIIPMPVLVIAGVGGIQLKMMSDICAVYQTPFTEQKGRSILLAIVGAAAPTAIGLGGLTGLVASIPFVGPFIFPATVPILAGGATWAVGRMLVEHLESGGSFLSFDASETKEMFAQRFEEGKAEAKKFASKVSNSVPRPATAAPAA